MCIGRAFPTERTESIVTLTRFGMSGVMRGGRTQPVFPPTLPALSCRVIRLAIRLYRRPDEPDDASLIEEYRDRAVLDEYDQSGLWIE